MSKLEELINQLCPNGVEYVKLGDIGRVAMCKRILKAETSTDGEVPFYKIGTFGKEPDAFITRDKFEAFKNAFSFPNKGDVLISAAGTIGRTVIYDGKPAYFQDSNIVWLAHDESRVLNKFLYYCYQLNPWYVSTGGTIARLYNDNIAKATIPLPPLPIQEEIVSILDNMTSLTAELTKKLAEEKVARQKQYEYYRDSLLSFNDDVPKVKLDDLCLLITKQTGFDYSATIKPSLLTSKKSDVYPFIQNKNFSGINIDLNTDFYIPVMVAKKFPKITLDSPSILISLSGKIGNVGYYNLEEKAFIGGAVGICKLKNNVNGKFVLYYLESKVGQKFLLGSVKAGSHLNITVEAIRNAPIPIPSAAIQNRIVNVLDKFNYLCTDISEGLPAEIEARKKQYEYYRDKLLTFKEKEA